MKEEKVKCQGECNGLGICKGKVQKVLVSGNGWGKPFEFFYCEVAIKQDQNNGFLVELINDHGLTESDYYTGITIQNS
jgi:hypothetical protein